MDDKPQNKVVKEITVTLEGELLKESGNSIEYKVLFDLIDGTAGSLERVSKILNQGGDLTFYIKPPREKCFEIVVQAVHWVGNIAIPLLPYANGIKESISVFLGYLEIKKALKGEPLTKEMVQTNDAGDTIIKDNKGTVYYTDRRNVLNVNIINAANGDPSLNKKIDKIAKALEQSINADKLSFGDEEGEKFGLSKKEVEYLKYEEKTEERPDSAIGFIRNINNKTFKGALTIIDDEKERGVPFELDIKDIGKLEKIVSNLAIAEGYQSKVRLIGERIQDEQGKIKKIIVNDIEIPGKPLNF
ncbi:MAG: hypothetical protein V1649_01860 [Patescibacteria group bacterium]